MSIFGRKRDDVPEIRVDGEEATVENPVDPASADNPEAHAPEATVSRKVKFPKTPWWS